MKQPLPRIINTAVFFIFLFSPGFSQSQVNSTFDIESTSNYGSISKMFTLSANRIGILAFDATADNMFMKIYNSLGEQTASIDITSTINWNHNSHGMVSFNAIQLNDGNIFITSAATSNSTGIQTYNARYVVIDESGVSQSSGQLNTIDANGSYLFGLSLDKLSDGKIVAVWRESSADHLTFRLFNADGTSAGNDVIFSGLGTSNSFPATYEFRLAAGKNGNFMVSVYFWNGGLRGFVFTNDGVNAAAGGATHFMVDATNVNSYGNTGLVGLPNGDFAACWWLSNVTYIKTMSPDGTTIVDKQSLPTGRYMAMIPSNAPGSEGFILAEQEKQDEADMGNLYAGLYIDKFNQAGVLQSTDLSADGWLIQPTFTLVPGLAGGYASAASFYKAFSSDPMMGMTRPTGDNDIAGRMVDFSMVPLPVSLLSYTATLSGNNIVQLEWKTASEENNNFFEIERSTDGRNYSGIGHIAATGTHDGGAEYRFSDPLVLSQTTYYRLKQFDIDGRMKNLGVKIVRKDGGIALPMIYPNPVKGSSITLFAGSEPLPAPYRIVDLQGRTLKSGILNVVTQDVNIDKIAAGTYLIQIGRQVKMIRRD